MQSPWSSYTSRQLRWNRRSGRQSEPPNHSSEHFPLPLMFGEAPSRIPSWQACPGGRRPSRHWKAHPAAQLARPRRPGQPPLTAVLIDSHRDVRQGYQEDSLALRHLPRKGSVNPAGLLHSDLQGSAHSSGLSSSVMKCSSRSRDQGCMLATWSAADKYDWKATRGFAGMLFDARPSPAAMYSSTPCKLLCDCL